MPAPTPLKTIVAFAVLAFAVQLGMSACRSQEDPSVAPEPKTPAGSDISAPSKPASGSMGNANKATEPNSEQSAATSKPPRFFGGSKAAAMDWPEDNAPQPQPQPQAPQQQAPQQQNAAPVQGKPR